jgi:putative transcriptional regulator
MSFHFLWLYLSSMKEKTRIYNRIKSVMVDKRKSREDIAKHIQKDVRTISRYLTNEAQPSIPVIFEIAEFLNCPVADLLVRASDPPIFIED